MSNVVHTNDDGFDEVVLLADIPVLVYYWAVWCGPCKKLGPIISSLADDYAGKVLFVKVNADENPKTVNANQVLGLPTIHIYNDSEVVKVLVGAQSNAKIVKALSEYVQTP